MPYSRITSAKNGADAIRYALYGKGHDGSKTRNRIVSGINLIDDDVIPYTDQMSMYFRKKRTNNLTETFRVVQSFGPDELDPNNVQDILAAHEIGRKSAERLFPNRQVVVCTQTDSVGGKIHNHIISNNIDMVTFQGMNHDNVHYTDVSDVTDEIAKDYVHSSQKAAPQREVVNQTVRRKRQQNEERVAQGIKPQYIWQDDLRSRIRKAASSSKNFDEFESLLSKNGVGMQIKIPKDPKKAKWPKGYITYELLDISGFDWEIKEDGVKTQKVPNNLRSRSNKLGYDFGMEALEELFSSNGGVLLKEGEPKLDETQSSKMDSVLFESQEEIPDKIPEVEKEEKLVKDPEAVQISEQAHIDEATVMPKSKPSDMEKVQEDVASEEAPDSHFVPLEEAERRAKEIAHNLYCKLNKDDNFDWEDFKNWRIQRKREAGSLLPILIMDDKTGLFFAVSYSLNRQVREYVSCRKKQAEEEKIKELENQMSLGVQSGGAESALDAVQDLLKNKEVQQAYNYNINYLK